MVVSFQIYILSAIFKVDIYFFLRSFHVMRDFSWSCIEALAIEWRDRVLQLGQRIQLIQKLPRDISLAQPYFSSYFLLLLHYNTRNDRAEINVEFDQRYIESPTSIICA